MQNFVLKNSAKIQQFSTKNLRLENGFQNGAPPRCSRLGRLPLCPCPLRASPHFVAPSGAFRSSCPAGPALDSSSCRFLQIYKGLRIFAKFSPLVQASAKYHFLFSLRPCAPFAVALWLNFSCLRSSLSVRQAHRLVGTPLPCLVGLPFFSKTCNGPLKLNNRTRSTGTLCHSRNLHN